MNKSVFSLMYLVNSVIYGSISMTIWNFSEKTKNVQSMSFSKLETE